jgi:hypothetical protein
MNATRSQLRINLATSELERLRCEIDGWLKRRRDLDGFLQYSTQLDTLDTWLHNILQALDDALHKLNAIEGVQAVYQTCHDVEAKLTWTRQVWRYFADKFDQRDEPALKRTLAAADEAVWSCFAGVYTAVPGGTRPAAPLPFIEPLYSANAIPRDQPYVLRNRVVSAPFLQEFLAELPLPVIGLPEQCARSPWWLIYIGHETGHCLQHELLPAKGLVGAFRTHLHEAALTVASAPSATFSTAPQELSDRWGAWGEEVFADAVSVYSLGPRAAWAIAELIIGNDIAMLTDSDNYPSAVVRLALMAQLSVATEPDGPLALKDVDSVGLTTGSPLPAPVGRRDMRAVAHDHLALVRSLALAIDTFTCGGLGSLRTLCGWQEEYFTPGGEIDKWRDRLFGSAPLYLKPSLEAPRLILSGGLAAWSALGLISDLTKRADAEEKLAQKLVEAMVGSRQGGKRSAQIAPKASDLADRSANFAQKLLAKRPEELGL